jgi:hypothetical protein
VNGNRAGVRWIRRRDQPGTPTQETPVMSRSRIRRATLLAVLAPVVTAGLMLGAGSASALPFEGDPTPGSTCLRLERLPYEAPAGSTLFSAHRYVLVLSTDC